MARAELRARRFMKFGLSASIVGCLGAIAAFGMMIQKWDFQENLIISGHRRTPMIMLALMVGIVCGFAGFLMSLEGAAVLKGRLRTYGWLGFWLGALGALAGLVLAVCFGFFKL